MASKKKKPNNKRDVLWIEAKQKCCLNVEDIRMAKEMGLNPCSLIKNIPSRNEQWKLPVKEWIRQMYQKKQDKAAAKKARKLQAAQSEQPPEDSTPVVETYLSSFLSPGEEVVSDDNEKIIYEPFDEIETEQEDEDDFAYRENEAYYEDLNTPPDSQEIYEEI